MSDICFEVEANESEHDGYRMATKYSAFVPVSISDSETLKDMLSAACDKVSCGILSCTCDAIDETAFEYFPGATDIDGALTVIRDALTAEADDDDNAQLVASVFDCMPLDDTVIGGKVSLITITVLF